MNPVSNNFLKGLRENWFLILFIGGLIMGWTSLQNRVGNVEASQTEQKSSIANLSEKTATLNDAIIEIKANYIFIKASLDKLNSK